MSKFSLAAKIQKEEAVFSYLEKYLSCINLAITVVAFATLVLYLFQTTSLTAAGFRIKTLEEHKQNLIKQEESLTLELARLQALPEIVKRLDGLELQRVATVEYLSPTPSAFVYEKNPERQKTD